MASNEAKTTDGKRNQQVSELNPTEGLGTVIDVPRILIPVGYAELQAFSAVAAKTGIKKKSVKAIITHYMAMYRHRMEAKKNNLAQ